MGCNEVPSPREVARRAPGGPAGTVEGRPAREVAACRERGTQEKKKLRNEANFSWRINDPARETKPIPAQAKPIPAQAKPIPARAKPIPAQAKPIPARAKPIFGRNRPWPAQRRQVGVRGLRPGPASGSGPARSALGKASAKGMSRPSATSRRQPQPSRWEKPAQCAMSTGSSACARMWLVAPPKIIWRRRLWV
jgi:hypothetical protein